MKGLISLVSGLFIAFNCLAQGKDSIVFSKNFALNEGLYINYADLRHNWPIPKEKISTKIDKNQLDFYTKLIESENINYIERDGSQAKIYSGDVWGFCQNNVVYINYKRTFFRIPLFGAISYFIASVEINVASPGYNPFINSSGGTGTNGAREIREFLLEFYSGNLIEFSFDDLELLLKKDEAIYNEFRNLSKKKKKEQVSKYIRLYNEKHPIYFPKN